MEIEMTHTPGPWTFIEQPVKSLGYYIQSSNAFIGEVGGGLQTSEEILENAILVASAPDLLAENIKLKKEKEELIQSLQDLIDISKRFLPDNPSILSVAIYNAKDSLKKVKGK
ncbi:hypothetical protein MYP_680 [Sporocytophaga myxococcoides]|uniref:Uncharacterized protein n=1 Tax=Sporocytophaga myxococcoides TaxID=153721 RepID=A0A098LB92_9BACT|nr:hypothetical protein [Sporocytophaga myxococcoides]GAL83453.1 hypothetical protein MYP_680 [Sporocytophaga myxococcoides]